MIDSLKFVVTEEMVTAFAELTGDRSLLHHAEDFARRSIYREKVVHGMLTVAFLALADVPEVLAGPSCPERISGLFTAPVFTDDELVLKINRRVGKGAYSYRIEKTSSGEVTARGALTVVPVRVVKKRSAEASDGAPLVKGLKMGEFTLEDISVGDDDGFSFNMSEASIKRLLHIISRGTVDGKRMKALQKRRTFLKNLIPYMLLSPSVGMSLPGKYATFLGFEAGIKRPLTEKGLYSMKGTVSHVSRSTRIVKKDVRVLHSDDDIFRARLNILVNPTLSRMPSMEELRREALDPDLDGRVVLVTGASRGIGETMAKFFALLGSKVVVNYFRGAGDAERIVNEIKKGGGEAFCFGADVSKPDDVKAMFGDAIKRFGGVDILINNAVRDFRPFRFSVLPWEEVQKDIDVIVKGAFNCCKEAVKTMDGKGGRIINILTVAVDSPPPEQTKYVIAKSALMGLTRSLAVEYASKDITVNMIVPNFVETDLTSHIPEAYRRRIADANPIKRNATPVDVARAAAFLASSYSSYTTGQKIMVTGGGPPFL